MCFLSDPLRPNNRFPRSSASSRLLTNQPLFLIWGLSMVLEPQLALLVLGKKHNVRSKIIMLRLRQSDRFRI